MHFRSHDIRGQDDGPRLLIVAGVHGDEWEPMIAVQRLAEHLRPDDIRGAVTLVPMLNEAAVRAGRRVGEDGLDLARTFPGRPDGRPTEQLAHEFTKLLDRADFLIDLHTGGLRLTIWPLAGYVMHADPEVLEVQRRMARAFGLEAVWGNDPTLEGRTLSAARDRSIPAIYVEYYGSGDFRPKAVDVLMDGCRRVMAELGMISIDVERPVPRFMAEDPSPGSGHLQAQHPSPGDGLFEPLVAVGDLVSQGAVVGYLTSLSSFAREPIRAANDGRIVAIRTLPRVDAGEALAVIVPFKDHHHA